MRVLDKIVSCLFFQKPESLNDDKVTTVIIDVDTLTHSGENSRQSSPQDKIPTLKRLATFVEREDLPLVAVLRGQPLRDVADGEEIRGVTVRYVERQEDAAGFIGALLKRTRRGQSLVVTCDRRVEKAAQTAGGQVMHSATFRKALEPVETPRQRQNSRPSPEPRPVDENRRIVNELIDPL